VAKKAPAKKTALKTISGSAAKKTISLRGGKAAPKKAVGSKSSTNQLKRGITLATKKAAAKKTVAKKAVAKKAPAKKVVAKKAVAKKAVAKKAVAKKAVAKKAPAKKTAAKK